MRTCRSGRPVASAAARAALCACVIALATCSTGCGWRSVVDVEPGAVYSSNPAYGPASAEDPAAGGRLRLDGHLSGLAGILTASGGLTAAGYGGDADADYVEADVLAEAPLVFNWVKLPFGYDASRRVRPRGIDLSGLHPRWKRTFSGGFNYYGYTIEEVSFEEAPFYRLDSRIETHTVALALPLSEEKPILLSGEYSWSTCDWAGLNDFEAEGGSLVLFWPLVGQGKPPRVDWGALRTGGARAGSMLAPAMAMPLVQVHAGWRRLDDFTGPVADPDTEITSFAGGGALSQRWGVTMLAVAAAHRPERSYVSNFQVRTSAAAGLSTHLGAGWRLDATLAYEEADRSMGPDLSLWLASARAEWWFAEDWRAAFGLRWRKRSSEAPDQCYEDLSVFAGIAWRDAFAF